MSQQRKCNHCGVRFRKSHRCSVANRTIDESCIEDFILVAVVLDSLMSEDSDSCESSSYDGGSSSYDSGGSSSYDSGGSSSYDSGSSDSGGSDSGGCGD